MLRARTLVALVALATSCLGASAAGARAAVPNDPFFSLQWGDQNTGQEIPFQDNSEILGPPEKGAPGVDDRALAAWRLSTGSSAVVVGVLDSGVQYSHPDLAANIWSNPGGVGGCEAGTHGFNAITEMCDPQDEDESYGGHGTHVAGIIGAVGNNGVGVTGVDWQTTIVPVKWVQSAGVDSGELADAINWLVKAKEAGVNIRVVNDSITFRGTPYSEEVKHAIEALGAKGILFVTAAGNTGENNDVKPRYPCDYGVANEICVTATNNRAELPGWANYGLHTVDLSAPGVSTYSTLRRGSYGYLTGGSMASAQVAGAAALILSVEPALTPVQLKARIRGSVDRLSSLEGRVITGGTLDICRALLGCEAPPPTVTTLAASSVTQISAALNGSVNPNGSSTECKFEYGTTASYGKSAPCSPALSEGTATVPVSAAISSLIPGTSYHFRVVAKNGGGESRGHDETLTTTTPPKLTVKTEPASAVTQTSATLAGVVNPNGSNVFDCKFEYGTTTAYGSSAPCAQTVGSGTSNVSVSAGISGLAPNTTYHFRIVARNAAGTAEGADQAFTSSAPTSEPESPPTGQPPSSSGQPGSGSGGGGTAPGGTIGVSGSHSHLMQPLSVLPALLGRSLRASAAGVLRVKLACPPGIESCTGALVLRVFVQARHRAGSGGHGNKLSGKLVLVTAASGSFTIAPGTSVAIDLRLALAVRRQLARLHLLRGEAIFGRPGIAGGGPGTELAVSLRASAPARRAR